MKNLIVLFTFFFSLTVFSQKTDWTNAPRNPIGFKHNKEHFNLKGDIYSSGGRIFDKLGNLVYNYGTRYYYDSNGKIIGNNYNDTFEYDSNGNVSMFKFSSGSISNYTFNHKNQLIFEKNTYGDQKTHTYDSKNRLIKTIVSRKGSFYEQHDLTYSKNGNILIVELQTINASGKPGFKAIYHYVAGNLVKEILITGTRNYTIDTDNYGNKIDLYSSDNPNPKHFKTYNRYYRDANKPLQLTYGYYTGLNEETDEKYETAYIDGKRASDIMISKGIKENEKVLYDGLTQTYYSVPSVIEENHTSETRIPVTKIISEGKPHISYSHNGKFINYVHGLNKLKSRNFAFIGPHMIDYRVDKSIGRTYIVNNYKNLSNSEVKEMNLMTADTASVLYLRELEKDNFSIVIKGKHIDYKKAIFEYLTNGDPVIFIDEKPLYVLTGFRAAKNNEPLEGKLYNGELDTQQKNTNSETISESTTEEKCIEGDCKEGWGKVTVNNIIIDATFKNSSMDGVAYITYPNNSYYHGEYKNNRRDGVGYYKWDTGNSYVGGWKNGKQHGLGYTMNKKGVITSGGLFEDGKIVTEATDDYRSGKTNGNCTGNCVDGFGLYTYTNGDKYWGFFKNNQRYGVGTYYWNNKSLYTGAYNLDGERNGYGIYTYVDGSVFKGMFVDDAINGLGIMKYKATGNIAKGVFNNKGAKVKDF